jgi:hypothetical protein
VSCMLLAALDQVANVGLAHKLPVGYNADTLREASRKWLFEHQTLVVDEDWQSGSEICLLREFGPDFWIYVQDPRAVGTHLTLIALSAVLSQATGYAIDAMVRRRRMLPSCTECPISSFPPLQYCRSCPPLHRVDPPTMTSSSPSRVPGWRSVG